MRRLRVKKIWLILLSAIAGIPLVSTLILFTVGACLYHTADFLQPDVEVNMEDYQLVEDGDSLRTSRYGSLYLNKYGLWEAKILGSPIERGAAYGAMGKDLLKYQEDVFVRQIHQLISSERWIKFLHKFVVVFNRNMAKHIPQEFREEIYAMSLSCTDEYNSYGTPYGRQLNYHAAHDIGHAMQEYMLVGCSSFAVWDEQSENGELVVGRNFDFYVGDDFAKNKILLFVEPTEGYKFASIAWSGMMGVLSGMNERGLTVTINAAKGAMPLSSAMPISLLTRQILQYASNIDEAYRIAQGYETFVSESLLIGSAEDGFAAIIEKSPDNISIYRAESSRLICTNHYQSEAFSRDKNNLKNIATSDSPYRYERLNELLEELSPIDTGEAAFVLRNRFGLGGKDIGLTNEKSINQFIAHHSVVFQPGRLRMWVSTSPWQLGEYVCYDLNEVFGKELPSGYSYALDEKNIAADTAALSSEYHRVILYKEQYKAVKEATLHKGALEQKQIEEFVSNNPNYFDTYNALGDFLIAIDETEQALSCFQKALTLEISGMSERKEIEKKIQKYDKRHGKRL